MATEILQKIEKITSIPDESHEEARFREAYASFGSEGVTATANPHGHLLQITRYLGNEPSGFYCVDLPDTPPPDSIIKRLDKLGSCYHDRNGLDKPRMSCDPNMGMQLEFDNSEAPQAWILNNRTPALKFIHDRWPLFVTETPAFDLSIQYLISEKTIYQEYSFKLKQGRQVANIPTLSINANLLIRNLNFIESNNENIRAHKDVCYADYLTPDSSRIIRRHGSLQTGITGKNTIALVIMPFINGQHCSIQSIEGQSLYQIATTNDELQYLQKTGEMVVTIAYTLEFMESGEATVLSIATNHSSKATQDSSQAAMDLWKAKRKMDREFEILSFTEETRLNFILRRNLEHVLSVCSIPTRDSSEAGFVPIALTCGDMSSHQVLMAASFYAFELLLLALEHLNDKELACPCDFKSMSCEKYKCRLRYRIHRVCQGHLLWLYETAERSQGSLGCRYWASGQMIKSEIYNADSKKKSNMDVPLNIIKVADFYRMAPDQEMCQTANSRYRSIVERWIGDLHKTNKNNEYVFPHSMEEATHEFFFAEQAVIWCALNSAEKAGFKPTAINGVDGMSYLSYDVQNSILQKFNCKSPLSEKRMIAVSRNRYGNKFTLQPQDTIIFHSADRGLFTTHISIQTEHHIRWNRMENWMNTLDYQIQLDETLNLNWDNPLQFALAIMISTESKFTDSQLLAVIRQYSRSVLLQSSSPNGLFPGQLYKNKRSGLPKDLLDYDSYWNSTFEVPYILWKYGADSPTVKGSVYSSCSDTELASSTLTQNKLNKGSNGTSRLSYNHEGVIMINTNQINIASCYDEWLYSESQLFSLNVDISRQATEEFARENRRTPKSLGIVIDEAIKMSIRNIPTPQRLSKGYIVNIPKANSSISPRTSDIHLNHKVNGLDIAQRALASFPKLLMHVNQMDFLLALTCYRASLQAQELSLFFDRHATYDKYFSEDIQRVYNKWTTELHLSFYQLIPDDSYKTNGIAMPKKIQLPTFKKDHSPKSIGRVSLSFKFDGDFFDRCWTCYFIEYSYSHRLGNDKESRLSQIEMPNLDGETKPVPWEQRRVLELLLVDKMLDEILSSTKFVLYEIKSAVLDNSKKIDDIGKHIERTRAIEYDFSMLLAEYGLFDKIQTNAFLSVNAAWQNFQRITDIVEEDLKENIDTVELWIDRENKRQDKPQWLRSSEIQYGLTIYQLSAMNTRKLDELRRCYDSIKSFNTSLTKRMEAAREKWEFQSSNNIRLFTYVTVAFLPLGFATSIFSMSGVPPGHTLAHMITTAVAALGITIVAFLSAKFLSSRIGVLQDLFSRRNEFLDILVWPCKYFIELYLYYPLQEYIYYPLRNYIYRPVRDYIYRPFRNYVYRPL